MKFNTEINMEDFPAWSGAIDTLDRIKEEGKIKELEFLMQDIFCNKTPTKSEINDFLWFDDDFIYESLRIENA